MKRPAQIEVSGETFDIEYDDDVVFATHPKWSLLGVGRSLREALENLLEEASWITDALSRSDPETFSDGLKHLVQFIERTKEDRTETE